MKVYSKEPPYIKVYTNSIALHFKVPENTWKYIFAFSKHINYAGTDEMYIGCVVHTDKASRTAVAKELKTTDRMVQNAVKTLKDAGIFIPVYAEGKLVKGVYFVNPWVIAKGEWDSIKIARESAEFIAEGESHLNIDYNGDSKVYIAPPNAFGRIQDIPKLSLEGDIDEILDEYLNE